MPTVKNRGQKVKLQHSDGRVLNLVVILSDSKQGYLAKDKDDSWAWYPINEWSEVK